MTTPLTILVTGGTGFIGKALIADRIKRGDHIIVVGRDKTKMAAHFANNLTLVTWEKVNEELLRNCDFIINLARANIGEKRWSRKRKQIILYVFRYPGSEHIREN